LPPFHFEWCTWKVFDPNMVHGCVEVRKDNHHFWFMMLTFYYKYLRCFFEGALMDCVSFIFNSNLCTIEMLHGFHYCIVVFVSYFNNWWEDIISILFDSYSFMCSWGCQKKNWLLIMIMEIDYLISWWRTFHNNVCFSNSCFSLSHSPKLELLHYCHLWIVYLQDSCHEKFLTWIFVVIVLNLDLHVYLVCY
jgi:hypothetical protein